MAFTKVVGAGIHTLSNITSHNINSSGIITATKFVGPFDGSSGTFSGNITAVDATFTGNVSIAKTLNEKKFIVKIMYLINLLINLLKYLS